MSVFKLNTGDVEFKDRQKKVFDQLLVLENNRKNSNHNEPQRNDQHPRERAKRSDTRHFRGKESIFKRPQNPPPKNFIKKIPDFKKNPHKWTKYSLEDVEDMTDESNTKSAMDFLKELAKRREKMEGIEEEKEMEELPSKIVFNKHHRTTSIKGKSQILNKDDLSSDTTSEEKASFSNSKLVMPEYVVGQKTTKKERVNRKSKPEKGKELKLDHLMFEDD